MTTTTVSKVCVESFHSPHGFFRRGQVVSPDSAVVRDHPEWFVDFGTPDDQWPSPSWDALDKERHERDMERQAEERRRWEAEAAKNVVKIPPPDLMRCTTDHLAILNGRAATVKRGSVVPVDHELVAQNESLWRPV